MGSPYHVPRSASRHFPHHRSAEYEALSVIAKSLEHPQRTILNTFIQQAVDTEFASQFFLDEVSSQGKTTISEFLTDWICLLEKVRPVACKGLDESLNQKIWQRDGGQCCISKLEFEKNNNEHPTYVYILPLALFEDHDMISDGKLYKLLSVYIGDPHLQRLLSLMNHDSSSDRDLSSQMILLSPRVFDHFRNGRLSVKSSFPAATKHSARYVAKVNRFIPLNQIETSRSIILKNQAVDITDLPNVQLLKVHQQFADAFAWVEIAKHMEQNYSMPDTSRARNEARFDKKLSTQETWSRSCCHSVSRTILSLWTKLPVAFRAFTYERLASVSGRLFGYTGSDWTYRLPFSLYLRKAYSAWASKHQAEFQSLQLVERYTQIPAPRAIDAISHSDSSFLLMTGLPGKGLRIMLSTMTDKQVDAVVQDLKIYIAELRQIPNETDPEFRICIALGGGILDWRIGDSQRKELKFRDETEFNQYLTHDLPLDKDMREQISKSYGVKHEIVFTHADLNMRNILVDEDMKISGIVDWKCAGWYPECWEYTKAHFTVRYTVRWIADVLDQVFTGYRDELQVEDMFASLAPSW